MASEAATENDTIDDEDDRNSDFDDLEASVALEDGGAPKRDPIVETEDMEVAPDPIVKEFGFDDGVINTLSSKGEHFFFVQTTEEVSDETSHFHNKGLAWQGVQIPPPRYDITGVELDSDPNDPGTIFAELYVPKWATEMGQVLMFDYMERGAWALRELYFPGSTQLDNQKSQDEEEQKVPHKTREPEKLPQAPQNAVILDPSSLKEALSGVLKKTEKEKKEEKEKHSQDLAELVYNDTDVFIPGKAKVSLSLSDPILPAIQGLLKKDRRMTPKVWKELRLQNYNMSPEQEKQLAPLSKLTASEEEETILGNLAPPLAKALTSLLKKNVDFHRPTLKMYDMIWKAKSSNQSEYATPLKTLEEAQTFIDNLMEVVQHQVMTQALMTYQIKLQIGNIVSGTAKDKITSKVMLNKIQDNLDNNPHKGVIGNMTKTVSDLSKTRKSLAQGMFLGKRSAPEVSLTADNQAKKQKVYQLSVRNKNDYSGSQGQFSRQDNDGNRYPQSNAGQGRGFRFSRARGNYGGQRGNNGGQRGKFGGPGPGNPPGGRGGGGRGGHHGGGQYRGRGRGK